MNAPTDRLELMFTPASPLSINDKRFSDYFRQYENRLDLSAAEISELWELVKKDIISLDQGYKILKLLGRQWHPQAEKALASCYLKLENPLSGWAELNIASYYTYSTLVNMKDILAGELEENYADRRQRLRSSSLISEIDRRLARPEFLKIEIKISRKSEPPKRDYIAEIIKSSHFPQDEGKSDELSFSDVEQAKIDDCLKKWQRSTSRETDLIAIGNLLYQKLFSGAAGKCLGPCLDNCLFMSLQDAKFSGVTLTLHLGDKWLLSLPWSCLCDEENNFLVRDQDVTVAIRPLVERHPIRPWDGSRTTRLLVIVSEPDQDIRQSLLKAGVGLVNVDTEEEKAHFDDGLAKWNRDSDRLLSVDIVYARDDEIFDKMSRNQFDYDAVHYFGHCFHNAGKPYLVFMDSRGARGPLRTAADFINLVGKNRALQLVTLVACQSAVRNTENEVSKSLAEELLDAGISTVVAMQTAIRRSTGLSFGRHFYHELIRTSSASAAFHSAVQAITVRPLGAILQPEWASPALFVRR